MLKINKVSIDRYRHNDDDHYDDDDDYDDNDDKLSRDKTDTMS